ncbi:hypothetical protein COO60DRAFT_1702275 [Scenedesmus sp. NREL 46B-D3]|nr:hypothetical protein COO60DRAFT_1702275 [Scenedesmus sp. NREL 46B-D3]
MKSIAVLDHAQLVQQLDEELLWQQQQGSIRSYPLGSRLLTWLAAAAAAAEEQQAEAAAAAAATAAAVQAAGHQVYRMEELEQQAAAAEAAPAAGQQLEGQQALAVVPDSNLPFTITMRNPKTLCELFNARRTYLRMQRVSAEQSQLMAMAGTRIPMRGGSSAHYGRYHEDVGAEADCFALGVWPDLRTVGSFRPISSLWVIGISQLVWASNASAAAQVRSGVDKDEGAEQGSSSSSSSRRRSRGSKSGAASSGSGKATEGAVQDLMQQQQQQQQGQVQQEKGLAQRQQQQQQQQEQEQVQQEVGRRKNNSPPNYPSPCLLGSPFTTLAVTHNYHSLLHAEPREHPFSYIVWLDVLGAGSEMQVGYFWLTAGLAFTPLNGSALCIDVRLVPHCSDPCTVTQRTESLEGRYGAALFIKPAVVRMNAKLWAELDQHLQDGIEQRLQLVEQLQQLQQFRWREEGYQLTCGTQGVQIAALTTTGVFYGIQTLLQALQATSEGLRLPHTQVADAPRFTWRGVLLDAGRHFFTVPFIMKLLDLMALYKMNRFHWHLTEDQGEDGCGVPLFPGIAVGVWRYPVCPGWQRSVHSVARLPASSPCPLTATAAAQVQPASRTAAASRSSSSKGADAQHAAEQQQQQRREGTPPGEAAAAAAAARICRRAVPTAAAYHGGYYSTADVAAVVAYAAERCIQVVPEVELPGHCCAALAAYPNLSCTGKVTAVSTHWGIHEDVYCAGNEDVFSFLGSVLDQVVGQFPCQYVHIGGDEVPKLRWEGCNKCQARMRQEGLSSEAELQSWFVRRVSKMLAARGRRLIGWDEILEGGLAEGATVMSWRGNVGGIIAAKSGHDVIMTPTSHCYFDYKQAPSSCEPGAWYACLPLQVVYQYDPIPSPWPDAAAAAAPEDCDDSGSEGMQLGSPGGSGEHPSAAASMSAGGSVSKAGDEDAEMTDPDSAATAGIQQRGSSSERLLVAAGGAAVDVAGAAAAAGPHFPGNPPGDALTSLLPAASAADASPAAPSAPAAAAAPAGNSGSSSRDGMLRLSEDEAAHILGSQANLWCEYVQDEETAEYMLLPRLAALAESVWTPVSMKDWGCFSSRLQEHLPLLQQLGYKYRPLS